MSQALIQLRGASGPSDLKIGDLARATGKTQRALRLYEEMGLLACGTRSAGGFRLYSADAISRVHWIAKLQDLGFTLQQIHTLVDAAHTEHVPREAMERVRALYADKQAEVAQQIKKLQQLQCELETSLSYLETCVDSCTEHDAHGTSGCGTCSTHSDKAPALVEGVRS